ncbi:hypothetical protein SAE02_78720 [Skermanella aerolata]|uniref:Chemotaxis protein CheZ n=1 Tax=Skermanella aerolata TaxID=393310 RepID=A0A512E4S1_9PROT|nr:hypothetical protein [Skermanella aerolata]KJB89878.1 hypothetical protein N826_11920 [Skermanella aerolata KACC 11604]GEO43724.1 hypothetical protein SAE02_78720 [Skermanella aerolata]
MTDNSVFEADLSESRYQEITHELGRTAEGRAFLGRLERRSRVVAVEEMRALIGDLRQAWTPRSSEAADPRVGIVRRELEEMSDAIVRMRREIATLRPEHAADSRILAATEELDAIVSATERATSDILNAAERLLEQAGQVAAGGLGALAGGIEAQATEILMACSFQDITGQRTTRVVNALRYLEQRVNAMIGIWADRPADSGDGLPCGPLDPRPDAHLLNGPAPPGQGRSQSDIDALFG